jgi:dihydrodipicolinate synthase/N-acetylneuraminate lyase
MQGTGVPLVTPFDDSVDERALRELVGWLTDRGVDFLVACGSTGEAPLLSVEERARVVEVVADAAPADVPVLAGTGHEGLPATRRQTRLAADADADAALVVTPSYYGLDGDAVADYYRAVADDSPIPVYLYSVPKFTGFAIDPATVGDLADHPNVAGMKDSSGDIAAFQRERRLAGPGFDLLVGSGGVYAPALDAGADGGVLALAHLVPELATEIHRLHRIGDDDAARALNADLVELNQMVVGEYGVPGVKAALRHRGLPAGRPRPPLRPLDDDARERITGLVDGALDR